MAKGIIYIMTTAVPGLIKIGKTGKENYKSNSCVWEDSYYFDFHGITKAFHPDLTDGDDKKFTPKRFIVIQMN